MKILNGNQVTFTDVTGETVSDAIPLDHAKTFSNQAVVDVNTPSAKTFDSPDYASLTNQSLTYTALSIGGEAISIELVDTQVPSQALEVSVDGNAITVNLELDAGTAAELEIQDLTYTADAVGTGAHAITIAYIDSGVPSQELDVDVVGNAITVTLALDAGTQSELIEQDLTYTAHEDYVGTAGDAITITYVDDGTAGAETVDVTDTDITVHMDDTAVTGSTATNIKDAIEASVPASALVTVAVTGTGSNVQAASAETPLAGGVDPASISTATEIETAIDASVPASALISVAVTGTGEDVQVAAAAAPLAGGVNPAIVSTGDAVKAAINADDPGAADLVLVSGTNGSPVTALAETNLTAGDDGEVDISDNAVTIPSHGLPTGLKGQLTSTGTLPGGLSTSTDYFIIVEDENHVAFASSLANALAGTAVDLTDYGTDEAVHTFTPTSIAGGSIKLQKSNDGENWSDEGSATSITADAVVFLEKVDPSAKYMRIYATLTAGSMDIVNNVIVKGNEV